MKLPVIASFISGKGTFLKGTIYILFYDLKYTSYVLFCIF